MLNRIIKNISWSLGGVVFTKLFTPIFSILIARLLTPDQFGRYSIALVVISSIDFIKDFGINEAIIASDGKSLSSKINHQFTIQLVISGCFFLLVFLFAGHFGRFFGGNGDISLLLRIMSLVLIIRSFTDPIITSLIKEKKFKLLFYRSLIPSLIYGIVSLSLLEYGMSETSLGIGLLAGEIALLVYMLMIRQVLFQFTFRVAHPSLIHFGKRIVLQRISTGLLLSKFDGIILSYYYPESLFGTYRMARNLSNVLPSAFLKELSNVIFSEVSNKKDSNRDLNKVYSFFGVRLSFFIWVASLLLVVSLPYLIPFTLGNQWSRAIIPMQIFCVLISSYQIRNTQQVILKSFGRLDEITWGLLTYSILFLGTLMIVSSYSYGIVIISKIMILMDSIFTVYIFIVFKLRFRMIRDRIEYVYYLFFILTVLIVMVYF